MKKNIIFLLIISFISCNNKTIFNVTRINNTKESPKNTIVYSLPKTVVKVHVRATKTVKRKGDYYMFAEKYLDLKNVIKKDVTSWKIAAFEFNTYPIPDTSKIYSIKMEPKSVYNSFFLSNLGMVNGFNHNSDNEINNFDETTYNNLKFQNEESEINNIFNQIPLLKEQVGNLSTQEEAKVLANKIIRIREDINYLLIGEADSPALPDGKSLKIMIKELKRLEKKYLTLFIGVAISNYYDYTFEFIPDDENNIAQKILFRFSPELGILDSKDMDGYPILIDIRKQNNTINIEKFQERQNLYKALEGIDNGIIYRIPDMAEIKIIDESMTLASTKRIIAQFGSIVYLPVDIFKNNNYSIEFYPEYGMLKSIQKVVKKNK